ncbi:MAG: SDR family oxidoreductase [Mycetocola sp.]
MEEGIKKASLLNRTTTLEDVGSTACFIASDKAAAITNATVNISGGAIPDY